MRPSIDPNLFERAVREHHAGCFRAALGIVRDEALAQDAVQETYRRVLEGRLDIGGARDLGKLLRCAAAREALMRLRSERARARREAETAMEHHERHEDPSVERRDLGRHVARELARLPDELRHALLLRFREELTFAEVGDVLAIAEPSAHERVQRGLEKLRERLARVGLAVAVPDLVRCVESAERASVPRGLENSLLGMTKASLASAPVLAALAGVVTIAAGVAWSFLGFDNPATEVGASSAGRRASLGAPDERAAAPAGTSERAEVVREASAAPQQPSSASPLAPGKLAGRVVDGFGFGVADASVQVTSVERDGKFAALSAAATTRRDGSFELDVPMRASNGQRFEISVRTPSLVHAAGQVHVAPGTAAPAQRIQLPVEVADRRGDWELELTVLDPDGRAVPGALARLAWQVAHSSGGSWNNAEVAAQTEPDGTATLQGAWLGAKLLTIDARAAGFAPLRERIVIDREGRFERAVQLEPGLSIEGSILDEFGAPLSIERLGASGVTFYATAQDQSEWFAAELEAPGRFRVPALAQEPHTLRFERNGWSPFTLRDVVPGGAPLAIELKALADVSDRGLHDAELHGVVRDRVTGAPVELEYLDVTAERVDDDSPALRDRDFAPLVLHERSVQVAIGLQGPVEERLEPPPPAPHAFALSLDEPGRYLVRVRPDGYAPTFAGPFEIGPRGLVGPLEVFVDRGATVRGIVRDDRGRPLAGAWVFAHGDGHASRANIAELERAMLAAGGRGSLPNYVRRSDARGRFELRNVPADGSLALCALHTEFRAVRGATLNGDSDSAELRFAERRAD
jgi:RNA polymerase sigma-70 factor (ECF subfamily)